MYSTARTPARPPKIMRRPRHWPESRLNGQTPTSALICRRSKVPSSGSAANKVTAVTGPMPGTPRSKPLLTPDRVAAGPARHRRGSSDALRASQWSSGYPSASGMGAGQRFFSAVNISTNWRRRWARRQRLVSSSFHGRGVGWIAWPKRASTRASKASVLARHPKALAKSRAWRGLITAVGRGLNQRRRPPVHPRGRSGGGAGVQPAGQLGQTGLIPQHPQPLLGRPGRDIQMGLGNIDPDPTCAVERGLDGLGGRVLAGKGSSPQRRGDSDPHPALGVERGLDDFGDRVLDHMMCSSSQPCTIRVQTQSTVRASGSQKLERGASSSLTGSWVPEGNRATTFMETLPNFKHTRGENTRLISERS